MLNSDWYGSHYSPCFSCESILNTYIMLQITYVLENYYRPSLLCELIKVAKFVNRLDRIVTQSFEI